MYWVLGHVHGRDVVAVRHRCGWNSTMQLAQKLSKPDALGRSVRDGPIFRFRAASGYSRLPFRRPGDEGVAKEYAVAESRASGIRATGPIGVGVGGDDR